MTAELVFDPVVRNYTEEGLQRKRIDSFKGVKGSLGIERDARRRRWRLIFPAPPLTCGFIVIHGDAVQLQVAVPMVGAGGVDAMFITDHLPELSGKNGEPSIMPLLPPL